MPLYRFQCNPCAYRFDRNLPVGTLSETCPKCKEPVARMPPGGLSSSFQGAETANGMPPDQGVSQMDYVADRAIGESARQGWEVIDRRNEDKRRLRRENPGHSIVKQVDGSYAAIPNEIAVPHQIARENVVRDLAQRHKPAPLERWIEEALKES